MQNIMGFHALGAEFSTNLRQKFFVFLSENCVFQVPNSGKIQFFLREVVFRVFFSIFEKMSFLSMFQAPGPI